MKASRHNSPNLDILRAIAVLTVVVDHLIPTFAFRGYVIPHTVSELTLHIGQSGVLAFFVHTSLVLMYSLERIPAPTHWAQAWRFYVRRAFRIYPLALVCVVAVVALGWPEASWKPYHPVTWQEVVANLMLVQNLWTGHSVLTPLWSLPYEVEMYLVLPVAYLIARRKDGLTWMIALVVASTLAGYAFGKLKHGHMNLAAYVPCFLAGVTCYLVRDRVRPRIAGRWWPLFVIGAVSAYCVVHTVSDRLIYWIGWIYCIGIAAAIPMFQDSASAWINRVAATVAKYSYGIYLLHAPALYVVFGLWQPGPLVVEVPLFVALTAVLSVAAYHLIEEPLVRVGRRLAGAGRSGARAGLIPEGCAGGCDNRSRRGGRALQPPMRLRRIAVALGTLTAASVLAHAERVAAKRMMMEPADISPPGFQLAGRALGGATPPAGIEVAAAAHLAGSAIAVVDAAHALVIDADSGDLVLVDGAGQAKARLAIGATADQLVFDATARRAYVAARASDEIVAVDVGAKLTVARRWSTPTEPYGVALTPDRATLLVTTVAARTLAAYDVASGAERWRRPLAPEPRGVAISPDGSTAIVTSLTTGSVERIELATPQGGASVSLAPAAAPGQLGASALVFGQLAGDSEGGRSHARNAFAARFVGHDLALVAHQTSTPLEDARFGENRGSYGGGFEPPIKHAVTFIATDRRASRTVSAQIADHQPKAIAWDPARDRAFIVGYGSDSLLVLGAASQLGVKLDRMVSIVGGESCGPEGVAVGADGDPWVFCAVSRKVVRVAMADTVATATPAGAAIAPTRMSKQAHEGFDLFRKGNDGRISSRGAMACSSCHPEAGSDGLSWRIETHELQTPLLAGRVAGTHPYKWDGGDRDLAISLTSTMRRLGGGGLTPGQTKSLAAYLEALPAPRVPARAPAAVARGQALFASDEVGCTTCHGGKLYTDNATHELGGTLTRSDTPSLVGLARSAPYYHDGSAATLEALLAERAAVHGMAETVSLTAAQRQDLIAYLETL